MKGPARPINQKVKNIFTWILSFFLLTGVELILLVLVACIPRTAIKKHTLESADYFMQRPVFYHIHPQDPSSEIDHYADAILLNILYHFNTEHPIASPLQASYYYTDTQNENENLYTALTTDVAPTYSYFRYWHGSTVLIRPLLTFLNIRQIYILFAVILTILTIVLLLLLFRHGYSGCAFAMLLSFISVSFWYIPMSLEYIWCFLLMLISGFCIICLYHKRATIPVLFFLLIGNITGYLDFLTTETLTLLFPLALVLVCMHQDNTLPNAITGLKHILLYSLFWGIGYVSSWIAKWSITSVVLKRNIFSEALSSASTRLQGEAENIHGIALSIHALLRNIACLFPFNWIPDYGYICAIICLILLMMFYYLFRKGGSNNYMSRLFNILYLIPYLRYLVLANHSYLHYFFTYRAQFASVFCLCMVFYYGIDQKLLTKNLRIFTRFRHTGSQRN